MRRRTRDFNLFMELGDRVGALRVVLRDRDFRFTAAFAAVFAAEDIRMLVSPPRTPPANAICERMIGTLRRELLDRLLIVSDRQPTESVVNPSGVALLASRWRAGPHLTTSPTGSVTS